MPSILGIQPGAADNWDNISWNQKCTLPNIFAKMKIINVKKNYSGGGFNWLFDTSDTSSPCDMVLSRHHHGNDQPVPEETNN